MAIVNISIDTEAKTISASVNGAEVPNVERAYVYKYVEYEYGEAPEQEVKVELIGSEKMDDVKKTWVICANQINVTDPKNTMEHQFLACLPSKK